MMNPLDTIRAKIHADGVEGISKQYLISLALGDIINGYDELFVYDNLVFTVGTHPNNPQVHVYGSDGNRTLLKQATQFMKDVWFHTDHSYLITAIRHPTIQKIAERLGWKQQVELITGHKVYTIKRGNNNE